MFFGLWRQRSTVGRAAAWCVFLNLDLLLFHEKQASPTSLALAVHIIILFHVLNSPFRLKYQFIDQSINQFLTKSPK
jgi:hypothetical protein